MQFDDDNGLGWVVAMCCAVTITVCAATFLGVWWDAAATAIRSQNTLQEITQ